MRYIHYDATSVCDFIANNNLTITRLPIDGRGSGSFSQVRDVASMLEKSHKLWGTYLYYFFAVAGNKLGDNLDMKKAVELAEAGEFGGFLLIAYQDGGIISVSDRPYSFQEGAEPAAWWYV